MARLAKVDRVKILSIDNRRDVVAKPSDRIVPLELLLVIAGAPSDVVNGSDGDDALGFLRSAKNIDEGARFAGSGRVTEAVAFLRNELKSESLSQQRGGLLIALFGKRGAVKTVDGVFERNRSGLIGSVGSGVEGRDQLQFHAVEIREGNDLFAESFERPLEGDAMLGETLGPILHGAPRHSERGVSQLSGTVTTLSSARPRKEREDSAGMPDAIAVIQVVSCRIVEVDGEFDEPESDEARIEIDVDLRLAGDGGDVMDAEDFFIHGSFVMALAGACEESGARGGT